MARKNLDTTDNKINKRVVAKIEFEKTGDKYEIKSAGLIRESWYEERTPLWERVHPAPSAETDPMKVSHRISPGQSGEQLDLTAPLREVNPGQTLNANSPRGPLGSFRQLYDGRYMIQLFKGANLSTILHETVHLYDAEMEWLIENGYADEKLINDRNVMRKWVGATDGQELTTEQREMIARGGEAYMREGKAPSPTLESAFARFKKWLTKIYRDADKLNVELTDEVRDVFSRLLATDIEIEVAAQRAGMFDASKQMLDALGVEGPERVYIIEMKVA